MFLFHEFQFLSVAYLTGSVLKHRAPELEQFGIGNLQIYIVFHTKLSLIENEP